MCKRRMWATYIPERLSNGDHKYGWKGNIIIKKNISIVQSMAGI